MKDIVLYSLLVKQHGYDFMRNFMGEKVWKTLLNEGVPIDAVLEFIVEDYDTMDRYDFEGDRTVEEGKEAKFMMEKLSRYIANHYIYNERTTPKSKKDLVKEIKKFNREEQKEKRTITKIELTKNSLRKPKPSSYPKPAARQDNSIIDDSLKVSSVISTTTTSDPRQNSLLITSDEEMDEGVQLIGNLPLTTTTSKPRQDSISTTGYEEELDEEDIIYENIVELDEELAELDEKAVPTYAGYINRYPKIEEAVFNRVLQKMKDNEKAEKREFIDLTSDLNLRCIRCEKKI